MSTETTVSGKIWLVVALCLGFGGIAIGVLMYELKTTSATYEGTLSTLQDRVRQQDDARVVQVTFKKQVQEWKDILLRGHDPQDLAKYSRQFRAATAKVAELGSALQASVTDPEARRAIAADKCNTRAVAERALENSLIGVPRLDVPSDLGEDRRVGQHRQDFRSREVFTILHAREHHQDRRRVLMDEIADRMIQAAGIADPRALHHRHLSHGRIGDRVQPSFLITEGLEAAGHRISAGR